MSRIERLVTLGGCLHTPKRVLRMQVGRKNFSTTSIGNSKSLVNVPFADPVSEDSLHVAAA